MRASAAIGSQTPALPILVDAQADPGNNQVEVVPINSPNFPFSLTLTIDSTECTVSAIANSKLFQNTIGKQHHNLSYLLPSNSANPTPPPWITPHPIPSRAPICQKLT